MILNVSFEEVDRVLNVVFEESNCILDVTFGEFYEVSKPVIPKEYGRITYDQDKTITVS